MWTRLLVAKSENVHSVNYMRAKVSAMRAVSIALVVLVGFSASVRAQCVDNGADHGRAGVKNRLAPSPLPDPALITVADAIAWPVPHV